MNRWTADKARDWYRTQPWLVGCNFLPSTAINTLGNVAGERDCKEEFTLKDSKEVYEVEKENL